MEMVKPVHLAQAMKFYYQTLCGLQHKLTLLGKVSTHPFFTQQEELAACKRICAVAFSDLTQVAFGLNSKLGSGTAQQKKPVSKEMIRKEFDLLIGVRKSIEDLIWRVDNMEKPILRLADFVRSVELSL